VTDTEARRHAGRVRRMFTRISNRYDLMNRLMTLGRDKAWRRYVVRLADLKSGQRFLDVGTGTGGIALEALRRDSNIKVTAVDFTLKMIQVARQGKDGDKISWLQADGQNLPFKEVSFDVVTSGYLIRNVSDPVQAFREQTRVTAPGGKVICLDTAPPPDNFLKPFILLYLKIMIPFLGRLVAGDKNAYDYLQESTRAFKSPEELQKIMTDAGLEKVSHKRLMFGTQVVLKGSRPRDKQA